MSEISTIVSSRAPDPAAIRAAGRKAAKATRSAAPNKEALKSVKTRVDAARKALRAEAAQHTFAEHSRLIATAEKETRTLAKSARDFPVMEGEPRVLRIAAEYLDVVGGRFSETSMIAFVDGFQEVQELDMGELWGLKPAILFVLLEKLANGQETAADLIDSLRLAGESNWKDSFEAMSVVDRLLARDPAGAYSLMDYESRDLYRTEISELAERSEASEHEVAEAALGLAEAAARREEPGRAGERRRHVGYYLVDRGVASLREKVGYRPTLKARIREFILEHPTYVYLLGIEIVTMVIVYSMLSGLEFLTPVFAGFFLLILPATQAAVDFMNNLATSLTRPRMLPKIDLSRGIPEDCATMVAVPTLLLNDTQVRGLAADLEIRYLANRMPNLYFALVTDSPDSDKPVDDKDKLVDVCADLIRGLNARHTSGGKTPFFLLHRHRIYNPSEGRWMGWERKRGKLLDLNQLLRGSFDSFPVKVGDLSVLPEIRYVITLDSDTQLPRGAAQRFVGAMIHPLNKAVLDPATHMVVEGYGILQPRIGVSIDSASRSFLASLYSGQTGFDIYTRAVSDVYQDLFGEGIFTGKGVYEVDAFRDALEQRFPENTLLSHDLIEGAFARAALVSDIELIDDYPSHFNAYNKRKHRWMRGDWQILRWITARVPDRDGNMVPNPVSLISRWKIVDNLRRSLFEPATLALLLSGWFYLPGAVRFWTMASLAMLLMPAMSGLLFSTIRAPWGKPEFPAWVRETIETFLRELFLFFLHLTFLLHDALLAMDAVVRSLARVFLTKQKLLEWETAAEAEASKRRKGAADLYLRWSPLLALVLTVALWFVRPEALPVALPILGMWVFSPLLSYWLGLPPESAKVLLGAEDTRRLRSWALPTWRYFAEFSSPGTHWLVPDNVREDGVTAHRLSPTNLGFLLNARIAAVHFGYLTLPEFVEQTRRTLEAALALERVRGHFLNWYATDRVEALEPRFVSTVDSGNLAACLWTLKQACLAWSAKPPLDSILWHGIEDVAILAGWEPGRGEVPTRERRAAIEEFAASLEEKPGDWAHNELRLRIAKAREWSETGKTGDLAAGLLELAGIADRLVADMDFSFLYDPRKKVATVGYNETTARLEPSTYDLLASESRIASFVAIAKGEFPQESWFHLGRRHTVSHGQRVLVSWTGTMFEYLMPALWMRNYRETIMHDSMAAAVRLQRRYTARLRKPWGISESACVVEGAEDYGYSAFGLPELAMKPTVPAVVISPYSSFLALLIDSKAAAANLRRMEKEGWLGRYGFYEAVDYTKGHPAVARSWMAHHQGMSLLAAANVLFDHPFQRYFHAEPYVLATELLLHERVPTGLVPEAEELPVTA
jgi:cyclic beta-1,2-glucan synthetase